jgi:gluconate 5-dehydrogenase
MQDAAPRTRQLTSDLFSLAGQIALVTGATRGLGLSMARALGEQGATVLLCGRELNNVESAVAGLRADGIKADGWAIDLSDAGQAEGLIGQVVQAHGRIDVLVNNAGTAWAGRAEDMPLAAWDKLMALNVRAPFVLCQAAGKLSMIPRRSGRIINIASIAGLAGNRAGTADTLGYSSSKGALISLTRALAAEWGQYGIRVNAIAPGFFPTRMTAGLLQQQGEEALARHAPLNRLGDEDDLKGAVVLLASAAGKHITGQVLAVDGGMSAT